MSWEVTSRLCFADLEDSFRFLEVYTGQADPVAGVKVYSIVGLNCPGSSIVLCSSLSWSFGCLFRKREWSCGQSVAKPRDWLLALSPLVASDEGLVQTICVSLVVAPLVRWPVDRSLYSVVFGRRWSSNLETCPAKRRCSLRSKVSILVIDVISRNSMSLTRSFQWMLRTVRRYADSYAR